MRVDESLEAIDFDYGVDYIEIKGVQESSAYIQSIEYLASYTIDLEASQDSKSEEWVELDITGRDSAGLPINLL